ncbi:MAG: hypothetical protein OEY70_15325, partial [Acidimicrobiia bacterium]|nr:hypothetical protein [Acidimicrobiia bacterium]
MSDAAAPVAGDAADDGAETERALAAEQRWLDEAYAHLVAMAARTAQARAVTDRAVVQENTVDARIARFHLQRR